MADETLGEIFAVLMIRFMTKPPLPKTENWYNVPWKKVKPRLDLNPIVKGAAAAAAPPTFQALGQRHRMLLKIGLTGAGEEVFRVPGASGLALYAHLFPGKAAALSGGQFAAPAGRQTLARALALTSAARAARAQIELEERLPELTEMANRNPTDCIEKVHGIIFGLEESLRSRAVGNFVYRMLYALCPKLCNEPGSAAAAAAAGRVQRVKTLTTALVTCTRDALLTDNQRRALQLQVDRFVQRLDLLEHPLPEGDEEGEIDEAELSRGAAARASRASWLPSLLLSQETAARMAAAVGQALDELQQHRINERVEPEVLCDPRKEAYKNLPKFDIKIQTDAIIPDNTKSVQERQRENEAKEEAKRRKEEEEERDTAAGGAAGGGKRPKKRRKRKELDKLNAAHAAAAAPPPPRLLPPPPPPREGLPPQQPSLLQ